MSSYYQLKTNMSRGQDDGTAKKYVCTYRMEYFCLEPTGLLASVSVFEDGFLYRSLPALLSVPVGAEPCSPEAYAEALQRCLVKERAQKIEQAREKAFKQLLARGNLYGSLDAVEEEPEPVEAPASTRAVELLGDFTVLDLEFQETNMLELAAIRYQNWQPVGQLLTFVRFRGEVNYHVGKLTGITAADVRQAPDEKTVLQAFRKLAGDSLLVAHNISADRRILEASRTRLGATAPMANPWLCTLAWARSRYPAPHKLSDLCARFAIPTHGAHRALRDVEMCFSLLRRMHREHPITELAPATGKRTPGKGQAALSFAA